MFNLPAELNSRRESTVRFCRVNKAGGRVEILLDTKKSWRLSLGTPNDTLAVLGVCVKEREAAVLPAGTVATRLKTFLCDVVVLGFETKISELLGGM